MAAASNGHYGAVDLLLRHKIKPDIQDNASYMFQRYSCIYIHAIRKEVYSCVLYTLRLAGQH